MFRQSIRPAVVMLTAMTLITGFLYPLIVAGVGVAVFSKQAAGSLIERDGKVVGSKLIGQAFSDPKYFWSRPSATAPQPYNAVASSGSNLGPLNSALIDGVKSRIAALKAADPNNTAPIPVDLVTASASGLDPQISVAAAEYQVARVARTRGLAEAIVRNVVAEHIEGRWLGFLGEPRVNVLELNLALDATVHP